MATTHPIEPTLDVVAPKPKKVVWATLLVLLLVGSGAALFWYGRSFYALDLAARLDDPAYDLLAPGKPIGHGYGVVGTALMLTNLLYVVRRRFPNAPLGSMRVWLNLHVTTGLFGSLLVMFHSAFQMRSKNATWTMLALIVVVVTGLVGRFIYAFSVLPDMGRFDAHLRALEALASGFGKELRIRLSKLAVPAPGVRIGLFRALVSLGKARSLGRARAAAVWEVATQFEASHPAAVAQRWRVHECAQIARKQASAPMLDAVMRSWRGLHRFAAILMILLAGLHVTVAWVFGYRWIFSK